MNHTIRVGIDDDNSILANGEQFRVPDLIYFAVGKPQLERLKRLPIQPFSNCVRIHFIYLSEGFFLSSTKSLSRYLNSALTLALSQRERGLLG